MSGHCCILGKGSTCLCVQGKHAVANGSLQDCIHEKSQKFAEMWEFPLKIKENILVKKKVIQKAS